MEESIGIAISVMVISSFVLCMIMFAFKLICESFIEPNEPKYVKPVHNAAIEKKKREEADQEKLAHKVRTQYPPPNGTVTSFEITNIKDSIVVTETVYAD